MTIYTDGACSGNPGRGGFGVVVVDEYGTELERHSEFSEKTTNNREELKAILWAFMKYGVTSDEWEQAPIVYSDSAYAVNTLTNWMFNWYHHNWVKANKQTPENLDLIKPYFERWMQGYRIDLRKIKGHNGNEWNELADQLATGKTLV